MTVAGGPLNEQVLIGQSALNTTHAGLSAAGYTTLRVVVEGSAGITAGAVQLEGALSPAFAGTWATLGAAVTAVASAVAAGGTNTPFPYVRARISTAIVDGTVTVAIVGN